MSETVLSISKYPTLPAWFVSEDEGEAWEWGDFICILQKNPPFMSDALNAMIKNLPMSKVPPAATKGIKYLYVLSMFYKKGRNPSGKDSSKPAEILTIEQANIGMLTGDPTKWDTPVFCSFKPNGRINSGRYFSESITKDVARSVFFEELEERNPIKPSRIGNIQDGIAATKGELNSSRDSKGCMIPFIAVTVVLTSFARHLMS